jgi:UDP-2,3-diacylglucosamine hydrolase
MKAFFFSDVHLGLGERVQEKAKENRLLEFLDHIFPETEQLFIVGDLFDFWFDYKTVIPRGFHRTLSALQRFTDSDKTVHYLVGNHDCWMGDFFQTEIGVHVYRGPFMVTIQGKKVFIHHGDGLAENDLGYRFIKPILRNPLAVRLYRWIHPDIGVPLARGSSRSSREYTRQKHYGEEQGMVAFAEKLIGQGMDIVVMGHHHRPSSVQVGHGMYVNLGDWITYNTYGTMADGTMTLQTWDTHRESAHG